MTTIAFTDTPIGPAISTTGKAYELTTPSGRPLEVYDLYPKDTAVILRRVLRAAFPGITFSVRTGRGAGVSAVDVRWTDGPTRSEVWAIAGRFRAGHFDGMTDSYTYAPDRTVVVDGVTYQPCCRYVDCERDLSPAMANRCIARLAAYWGGVENMPTAIPSPWSDRGFTLTPRGIDGQLVCSDLGNGAWKYEHTWASQIQQCAEAPEKFVHAPEYIDIGTEILHFVITEGIPSEA